MTLTSEEHGGHHLVPRRTNRETNVRSNIPVTKSSLFHSDEEYHEARYAQRVRRVRKPQMSFGPCIRNTLLRPAVAEEIQHRAADEFADDSTVHRNCQLHARKSANKHYGGRTRRCC
jgi:hypothetical protein